MKLPKKLKTKWLKALRSGKYKQDTGTMYNPNTKGFCCLGVLEHIANEGKVEVCLKGHFSGSLYPDNIYRGMPTVGWCQQVGIEVNDLDKLPRPPSRTQPASYFDGDFDELASMNDRGRSFEQIAAHIERTIETI